MIKLGHIEYSNCFPVHALFLSDDAPHDIKVVTGTPAELNQALERGQIDVAPSSSIEYARHLDQYRLLPDFVIGSDGPVGSILFDSDRPIEQLHDCDVAVPTASATSVVLLKILLQLRYNIKPRYRWFSQEEFADAAPADTNAALFIGDVALKRRFSGERHVYDLGAQWKDWTGLPFVFAAWQTSAGPERDTELQNLLATLHRSRRYFLDNAESLARAHAGGFGIDAPRLLEYWQSLRYNFDEPMRRGLLRYYELAAAIGESPVQSAGPLLKFVG
jgi:chorismate dehydratase